MGQQNIGNVNMECCVGLVEGKVDKDAEGSEARAQGCTILEKTVPLCRNLIFFMVIFKA